MRRWRLANDARHVASTLRNMCWHKKEVTAQHIDANGRKRPALAYAVSACTARVPPEKSCWQRLSESTLDFRVCRSGQTPSRCISAWTGQQTCQRLYHSQCPGTLLSNNIIHPRNLNAFKHKSLSISTHHNVPTLQHCCRQSS